MIRSPAACPSPVPDEVLRVDRTLGHAGQQHTRRKGIVRLVQGMEAEHAGMRRPQRRQRLAQARVGGVGQRLRRRGTAGSVLAQPPISSSHASSTTPNRRRVMAVGVAVGIRRVGQVASDAFPLLGHGHGAQARRGDGSTAHAVVKLQIADPARHHGRRDVELAGARREAVPGHRLLERAH
jgi:hypothetical protein